MIFSTQALSILTLGGMGLAIVVIACHPPGQMSISSSLPLESKPSLQASTMNKSIEYKIFDVGYSPLEGRFESEPKFLVFRDEQTWAKFWQRSSLLDLNLQKRSAPDVNFDQHIVIGLTSGSRPTGGFSIHVDWIEPIQDQQDDHWVIHYTETVPGKDCLLTQQPTTPTVFLLTERSNVSISLQGQKVIYNCSN